MSYLDVLTDRDLKILADAIDKMEKAMSLCPHSKASEILSLEERHAILGLALGTQAITAGEQARMN